MFTSSTIHIFTEQLIETFILPINITMHEDSLLEKLYSSKDDGGAGTVTPPLNPLYPIFNRESLRF